MFDFEEEEEKSKTVIGMMEDRLGRQDSRDPSCYSRRVRGDTSLSNEERRFMLNAERGDCASVLKMIESTQVHRLRKRKSQLLTNHLQPQETKVFEINCIDPLGRTALSIAIINENPELMEILLDNGIQTFDSLLLAIDEEYVEGRGKKG